MKDIKNKMKRSNILPIGISEIKHETLDSWRVIPNSRQKKKLKRNINRYIIIKLHYNKNTVYLRSKEIKYIDHFKKNKN